MNLKIYEDWKSSLLPLHHWNKKVKGQDRGKTPIVTKWSAICRGERVEVNESLNIEKLSDFNNYNIINTWVSRGFNLGYVIPKSEIIVDVDFRNMTDIETTKKQLVQAFGFNSWDELLLAGSTVKTGSGGYHIYCNLPLSFSWEDKSLKTVIDDLKGVDFKSSGSFVVCANSKHPNGNIYTWEATNKKLTFPQELLDKLIKNNVAVSGNESDKFIGCIGGGYLYDSILSNLNVVNYRENDKWLKIMMASHHATKGEGLDDFIQWSVSDEQYKGEAHNIRTRWNSLTLDKAKSVSVLTLASELKDNLADVTPLLNIIGAIENNEIEKGDIEKVYCDRIAKMPPLKLFDNVEKTCEMLDAIFKELGEGNFGKNDIIKCCSLLIKLPEIERILYIDEISGLSKRPKATIRAIIKHLVLAQDDETYTKIADYIFNNVFVNGLHLAHEPSGQIFIYNNVYWVQIKLSFLEKIIDFALDKMGKLDLKRDVLISTVSTLVKVKCSSSVSKFYNPNSSKNAICCTNCEIHFLPDGTYIKKEHSYDSYISQLLEVEFNEKAKGVLFQDTLSGIFDHNSDPKGMIDYMSEIYGYLIQPYKNLSTWWLWYGLGGEGKSLLLDLIGGILGDLYLPSDSNLIAKSNNRDNHLSSQFVGKMILSVGDLTRNVALDDGKIKELSDNKVMTANPKGLGAFKFMYSAGVIVCSNYFPNVDDNSDGFQSRCSVVHFKGKIRGTDKEDKFRKTKLLSSVDEKSAILNFALKGLKRLRDRGKFQPPKECLDLRSAWLTNSNSLQIFVREKIIVTRDQRDETCTFTDLYDKYVTWCSENTSSKYISKIKFSKELRPFGLNVVPKTDNKKFIVGGRLIENKDVQVIDNPFK